MFCENCGFEQSDTAVFCAKCGAQIQKQPPPAEDKRGESANAVVSKAEMRSEFAGQSSPNVVRDQNGNLSWVYEFSFWKNPSILLTAWKVMMLACLAPGLLMFFLSLGDGLFEAFKTSLMVFGIAAGAITVLLAIAYPLLALMYGGKYCVLFKMDDQGVDHIQLKKQFQKAQALGFLTLLMGLAGNNFSAAGAGLMSATRQSMHTTFSKVKSVKINESRHTIYLNETLNHNQVYAEPEDFSLVKDYILSHCPKNAKIKA